MTVSTVSSLCYTFASYVTLAAGTSAAAASLITTQKLVISSVEALRWGSWPPDDICIAKNWVHMTTSIVASVLSLFVIMYYTVTYCSKLALYAAGTSSSVLVDDTSHEIAASIVNPGQHTDRTRLTKALKRLKIFAPLRTDLSCAAGLSSKTKEFSALALKTMETVLGQALQIRRLHQDTHYVFTHGQSCRLILISYLIKAVRKRIQPNIDMNFFQPLRSPYTTTTPQSQNLEEQKNSNESIKQTLSDLPNLFDPTVTDHNFKEELLCADAAFWRFLDLESALSFFTKNLSLLMLSEQVVFNIIDSLKPPENQRQRILSVMNRLFQENAFNFSPCGNLHLICIPKQLIDENPTQFLYPSHSFGRTCRCYPPEETLPTLQRLQREDFTAYYAHTPENPSKCIPQYRLYSNMLRPEWGVRSFAFTPIEKSLRKRYKEEIEEALTHSEM